jgi:hypothetical protein
MNPDTVKSDEKASGAHEPLVARRESDEGPKAADDGSFPVPQPMGSGESSRKRMSEGYEPFSDDEDDDGQEREDAEELDGGKSQGGARKKRPAGGKKREIKNAREKERSSRIAKQIDELRDILSACGVMVPKGTKSSVLSEVATYIRLLQQQQVRSEV